MRRTRVKPASPSRASDARNYVLLSYRRVDVVLLDLLMPRMHGLDVLPRLHRIDPTHVY
jgi:response regulator RpfG family c-di-GMP phosphodiesterase